MKLKLVDDFDSKRKAGYELEVDKVVYSPQHAGNFKVRVVNEWKRPQWFAITWFVPTPYEDRFRDLIEDSLSRIEAKLLLLEENVDGTVAALDASRDMIMAYREYQHKPGEATSRKFVASVNLAENLLNMT